jgi:hypothetical protein
VKKCRICGETKPDERFKAYNYNGKIGRMRICNTCRSRRDNIKRKDPDALAGYSDIDLIYALQLRGYRIIHQYKQQET